MKTWAFLYFILFSSCAIAQGEGNNWYFGNFAGVTFNTSPPSALNDGALNTVEGCASISDASGNLLFYTDGISVWNQNHDLMPNGTGLLGNSSSSQAAIIVQSPGSNSLFYIFTVDANAAANGLMYSQVDMNLDGGLGDVNANKNIPIVSPTCEKVTAVQHQNSTDFWIVTHLFNSDAFHSYLLTSSGLEMVPVVTNIGIEITTNSTTLGYMKSNPAGNKIAIAHRTADTVELLDFDNSTGSLSNLITLNDFTLPGPYGVEFSPNNNLLYVSESSSPTSNVYQYNLMAGSDADIVNSRVTIGTHDGWSGAIQLAPDDKIYHARYSEGHLGTIHSPNSIGVDCDYEAEGLFLGGQNSNTGLPTFFNSIFNTALFTADNFCFGDSTTFTLNTSSEPDSASWNFDDPSSGIFNTSSELNPAHVYSDTGTYSVSLITYFDEDSVLTTNDIIIQPLPVVDLGNDTTLCEGNDLILDVSIAGASYLWSDNSTSETMNVDQPGTYWVQVELSGCHSSDSVDVTFSPPPPLNLGNDTTLCSGQTFTLDASTPNATYHWQNGSQEPFISIEEAGSYWVELTVDGCIATDTVEVTVAGEAEWTSPGTACEGGEPINLNPFITGVTGGTWSGPGITDAAAGIFDPQVAGSGVHSITYSIAGPCPSSSTAEINVSADFDATITPVDTLCLTTEPFTLSATDDGGNWSGPGIIDSNTGLFDPVQAGIGTWQISYVINDLCGDQDNLSVTIVNPSSPIVPISPQCIDAPDIELNSTISEGTWSGSGIVEPDAGIFSPLAAGSGVHEIEYHFQSEMGCTGVESLEITVHPTPEVDFSPTQMEGCLPMFIEFINLSDAGSCEWNFGDGASFDGCDSVYHTYNQAGTYSPILMVTNDFGCSEQVQYENLVTVHENPTANFSFSPTSVSTLDGEVFFTDESSGNIATYSWDFGGEGSSDFQHPTFLFEEPGAFYITLGIQDVHNCSDSVEHILWVEEELHIYIPNTITLNWDGLNDVLSPVLSGVDEEEFRFQVFDRWGQKIYESKDIHNTVWLGGVDDYMVPPGPYTWQIQVRATSSKKLIQRTGVVNVVR